MITLVTYVAVCIMYTFLIKFPVYLACVPMFSSMLDGEVDWSDTVSVVVALVSASFIMTFTIY